VRLGRGKRVAGVHGQSWVAREPAPAERADHPADEFGHGRKQRFTDGDAETAPPSIRHIDGNECNDKECEPHAIAQTESRPNAEPQKVM
jgi:hypothetical protein